MKMDEKWKTPEWTAAWAALISGIAVHCFALVNILHNYDNILQQPKGYGAGITSGRWLLSILGDIFGNFLDLGYNFPAVNGLAYLVLVALSAALVIRLLKIQNRLSCILAGCLMATFPTVCATMLFRFTSVYYGLCLLLSVLAAWAAPKPKYGIFLSALFTACALGIYQAYTPVTIGLFVLILMGKSLEENADFSKLVRLGLRFCVALVLGLGVYFVLLKLSLAVYSLWGEVTLDSYLGINEMGKLKLVGTAIPSEKGMAQRSAVPGAGLLRAGIDPDAENPLDGAAGADGDSGRMPAAQTPYEAAQCCLFLRDGAAAAPCG